MGEAAECCVDVVEIDICDFDHRSSGSRRERWKDIFELFACCSFCRKLGDLDVWMVSAETNYFRASVSGSAQDRHFDPFIVGNCTLQIPLHPALIVVRAIP